MKRLRITTMLLVLCNALLAALVVMLWSRGQARVSEPAHLAVTPLSLPDLAALSSIPMHSVDMTTIREQAVFYESRAFYQPPPVQVEVSAPEYEMSGTLRLADGRRIGFVRKKADSSGKTLHVGEDLEGWRVQAIEPDRIILGLNERNAELRSGAGASVSGLIRGSTAAVAPPIAQTGVRVLGAIGAGGLQTPGRTPAGSARTYRPPPPAGK
jgi:hypothetical protein